MATDHNWNDISNTNSLYRQYFCWNTHKQIGVRLQLHIYTEVGKQTLQLSRSCFLYSVWCLYIWQSTWMTYSRCVRICASACVCVCGLMRYYMEYRHSKRLQWQNEQSGLRLRYQFNNKQKQKTCVRVGASFMSRDMTILYNIYRHTTWLAAPHKLSKWIYLPLKETSFFGCNNFFLKIKIIMLIFDIKI